MTITYHDIRSQLVATVVSKGVIPKDDARRALGTALGLPGLVEQSETYLSDVPLGFIPAFEQLITELHTAGVLDLEQESLRTYLRKNQHTEQLFQEDPQVSDTALSQFADIVGRDRTKKEVIDAVTKARRVASHDDLPRDNLLDELIHFDRRTFLVDVIPTLFQKLGYSTPQHHYLSGDKYIPFALVYRDRFDFTTMVRAINYSGRIVIPAEVQDFVTEMKRTGATQGIFLTTSNFEPQVLEHYKDPRHNFKPVRILNGYELADLFLSVGYDLSASGPADN